MGRSNLVIEMKHFDRGMLGGCPKVVVACATAFSTGFREDSFRGGEEDFGVTCPTTVTTLHFLVKEHRGEATAGELFPHRSVR